ncbi:hippurate hydrolase [Pseudooceanicola nitratireducens]|jgi:hippurate hydrolase|uniref:Hippurate hydrolase n=1 Tax=Pseudooceanicola nitratireducens TaxID=517719 RepID=A0A1I1LAI3_9RHOB|nr:M20 aminoacylase family protein [Pseudooceanicola nitratireducens]SEJ40683.1 hippurate hydrolase [Pseudooceanicola nitratireducens]SFC67393.1 hippurate hydrolase [Pseudooceanicola nitratireducens]
MPVINRIAGFADEMQGWRRHLHQHPELGFDCHQTAAFVAERLREFGVDEIHEGIARTGLVALIHGRGKGGVIGLRADMDALPIEEATGADHASTVAGKMHACGHDGHTTMLLGAAKYLAETRNFTGTVALIFQPAEEDGGGGGVMVDEGIMDRFKIDQVYAMHNAPGFPAGMFMTGPGPVLAAVDTFHVHVKGVGGHAANPHETRDPIPCAISIIQAVNTIVSRNAYAGDELVVSVTQIHAGSAENVIPDKAYVNGTVRTFDPAVQDLVEARLKEIVDGQAAAFGVEARLGYDRHYPATVNDVAKSEFAAEVARDVSTQVEYREAREMGAEDFSFMLQARPGAFMMLGQGVDSAGLHQPDYDFNDEIAPIGASYFVRLVERAQPVE